jgi:glycosyltransferase involved in cell wall biosynthesis
MHAKNLNAIRKCKDLQIDEITNSSDLEKYDIRKYDAVYSPCVPIDTYNYPNTKFIFGPHFSVFPDNKVSFILRENCVYIQPSEWCKNSWKEHAICNNLNIQVIPFGVDTERFKEVKPLEQRKKVFIYFKTRHPVELDFIKSILNNRKIEYKLFNYAEKYEEREYIDCLQNAKYGIWLGRHESQGFALEEALSCNVPLLVWDVTSMNQEHGYKYPDIKATSIPYWDNRCGEVCHAYSEIEETLDLFLSNIEKYKPRDYVLENLSFDVCSKKWLTL